MPYLLLLVLALAYLQDAWPEPPPWLTPVGSVLLTWAGVVAVVAAAGWAVHRFSWRVRHRPERLGVWLRRYVAFRRRHLVVLFVVYLLSLYAAGWGWTVKHCLTYGQWTVPGAELLILLPFLAGLFLSWARFYDAELAVHTLGDPGPDAAGRDEMMSRWTYVGLQARQSLMLAAPPFVLLVVQQGLVGLVPSLRDDVVVMPVLSGALLAGLFVGQSLLLRALLGLRRVPDGPLRDRLEATARRLSFRCSDILVWDTRDTLATALLVGPLPVFRYVVLTDRLLGHMDHEEVEAVFAHEVGHVKHRHMGYYLLFLVGSLVVLTGLWRAALESPGLQAALGSAAAAAPWPEFWRSHLELLLLAPLLLALAAYVFVVFGYLSRRCERQADLYACRNVSFGAFLSALDKVAWLNGLSPDRPGRLASWRHGTIARRRQFLLSLHADRRREAKFQQETGLIQWAMLVGLGGVMLWIGPTRLWEMLAGM